MTYLLNKRAAQLEEIMDAPDCNKIFLHNTYVNFKTVNQLFSRWESLYQLYIKPLLKKENRTFTLLDVGCGGGDIPIALAQWVKKDDLSLEITAIDTDGRAIDFAKKLHSPQNISFKHASTQDLITQNKSFDIVISNNLIHHLSNSELREILPEAEQLAKKLVIFNDMERSDLAYFVFNVLGMIIKKVFPDSFIWVDGRRSIQRSYTQSELIEIAPANWQVKPLFPFRLLLIHSPLNR
ncbi:MAG: methyltransferase domain-containing protein [Xenococcus sp. MO_188.B8]|nr:methyltransferase domain-containing protein [Xenococcus sp. MO_188.B8]